MAKSNPGMRSPLSKARRTIAATASLLAAAAWPCAGASALGNNVASYTYTGNQAGLTTNTVYTLSTYGQHLGACSLVPNGNNSTGYVANCYTNYGNQNPSLYTAVAFLGTVNNPNNAFVVGDGSGAIALVSQHWTQSNGAWVSPGLNQSAPIQACPSGSAVSNLAVDPNGLILYIGCTSNKTTSILNTILYSYSLYTSPIISNGSLGPLKPILGAFRTSNQSSISAAVWPGISPVMRTYQPNTKSLESSTYSQTGGVMISGLIGDIKKGSVNRGLVPVSSGIICSNGQCQAAYNITLEAKDSISVLTAAEIGIDNYSNTESQALYWNQVAGELDPLPAPSTAYNASINWSKTSNTLYSCNLSGNPIGSPSSSCGPGSHALDWPAQDMPAAGRFTQGLLTIGTWTNGYLAYHSPASLNSSTTLFLASNGKGGKVGNINSLMNDVNGNLMIATNESGLLVFNPFGGQNTANGSSMRLILNDSESGPSGCSLCKIADATEIVYYTVKTIQALTIVEGKTP